MTKRKVLIRVTIGLLIFLVICTVLSRSIYLAMLPQVSTSKVSTGSVNATLNYTGTFDYTNKQTVKAGAAWNLTEVNVKAGQSVNKGDVLAKVDMTDADLTRRQLEFNVANAKAQLKNAYGKDAKAQVQLSVDMAERSLEQFIASYPKDGVIKAETDGSVLSCNFVTGDTAAAGTVVMEIRTEESAPIIQWNVNGDEADKFDVGTDVTVTFMGLKKGSKETFTLKGSVSNKTTDVMTETTTCQVELKSFNNEIPLNSVPTVTYSEITASGAIVPVSALTAMGGDNYILYVVNTRQGVFGEEHVVKQVEVKKTGDNNVDAVVDGDLSADAKVVTYSSKALSDGLSVALE